MPKEDYTIIPRSDIGRLYDKLHRLIAERAVKLEHRLEHIEDQIVDIKKRIDELRSTLQKLGEELEAIREDIAIEARERVASYLASEKGVEVELKPLETSGISAFDMYGISDSYTIIGRAYVVASRENILSLLSDLKLLMSAEPSLISPDHGNKNIILAIYALRVVLKKEQISELVSKSLVKVKEIVVVTPREGETITLEQQIQ